MKFWKPKLTKGAPVIAMEEAWWRFDLSTAVRGQYVSGCNGWRRCALQKLIQCASLQAILSLLFQVFHSWFFCHLFKVQGPIRSPPLRCYLKDWLTEKESSYTKIDHKIERKKDNEKSRKMLKMIKALAERNLCMTKLY